jgi:hypothetical protein
MNIRINKIVCSTLSLLILAGCAHKEPVKTGREGQRIPDFSLFLVDSSTYLQTATLPVGQPVVFFYFGHHCPYSRAQMEGIIDDMESFRNVQFVLTTTFPFDEMKGFYRKYQLDKYPNVKVGVDYRNFFPAYFKATGVPYIAIYGRDDRLKDAFEGQMPVSQLRSITSEQ